MKKKLGLSLLAAFLAALCLPLAGCGDKAGKSSAWSIERSVGPLGVLVPEEEAEDGKAFAYANVYGTTNLVDGDAVAVSAETGRGYWKFATEIAVDIAYGASELVGELRVYDEQKTLIGYRAIYRDSFADSGKFQEFGVAFYSSGKQTVEYRVNWTNRATLRFGGTSLKRIGASEYQVQDLQAYLEGEDAVYDENALYYFDVYHYAQGIDSPVDRYDVINLVTTLQGLANREGQRLFVRTSESGPYSPSIDDWWLDYLTGPEGWLSGRTVVKVDRLGTLLKLFENVFGGFVVWDNDVPATSNAAATACGIEDLLPVRYSAKSYSLYDCLIRRMGYPVKLDLHDRFRDGDWRKAAGGKVWDTSYDTTYSAKCDAYLWAKAKYLDTGLASKTLAGWQLDAYSWDTRRDEYRITTYYSLTQANLANRDYLVANRAFFFDLCIHDGVASSDDPGQKPGTDFATLTAILAQLNKNAEGELVTVTGFIPWWIKYTENVSDEMPTGIGANEWWSVTLMSTYHIAIDADAFSYTDIGNASIYTQFPAAESYTQKADTSEEGIAERVARYTYTDESGKTRVKGKNYIVMYMGDYDSSAWLNMATIRNMNDPNLGKYPLTWPINTILAQRIPHVLDAIYSNFTENDYFVGDHNGYGYFDLNVYRSGDAAEGRFGSLENYMAKAKESWERYDLDLMGWLLLFEPTSERILKEIVKLSPYGIVSSQGTGDVIELDGKKYPYVPITDLNEDVAGAVNRLGMMFSDTEDSDPPSFSVFRSILKTPTHVTMVMDQARAQFPDYQLEVIDPYTFMELYRIANE